jgi:TonB family protein
LYWRIAVIIRKLLRLHRCIANALLASCLVATYAAATEAPAPAAKQEAMLFADDPKAWSTPRVVLPPDYPQAMLAKGVTGYVDIETHLSEDGVVDRIVSINSEPKSLAFEEAVKDAITHWRFDMPIGPGCKPVDTTVVTRVWFEIKDGKESVSVSRAPMQALPQALPSPRFRNYHDVVKQLQGSYPQAARKARQEGRAFVVLTVDGDTGKTDSVDVAHVAASRDYMSMFGRAAQKGFGVAEVDVGSEHKGRKLKVCKMVTFRLSR